MKALKYAANVAVLALTVALITACQGKDPGANYSTVKANATQRYDATKATQVVEPPAPPADGTDRAVCTKPFELKVTNAKHGELLEFTEDQEFTYIISVRSFMGDDFKVSAFTNEPTLTADIGAKRLSFAPENPDQVSGNLRTYKFTWHPGKLKSGQVNDIEMIALKYSSAKSSICGDTSKQMTLLVSPAPASTAAKGAKK